MILRNSRLTAAMAHDLRIALDPAAWCESVGFVPDDWQRRVLRSASKRVALNCARQSGKSTVAAAVGLHGALYTPHSLTIMLSPTLRQSSELFRKSLGLYGASGRPYDAESETKLSLELDNGSRLISLPGSEASIRGYSKVSRLIVDEASRVPDELYAAVRPMLAVSDGSILTLSTPFGTRGWWWETMNAGSEDWERYTLPATENPRIRPEFLEDERRTLGEFWYAQEYECRFLDSSTAAFRSVDIDAAQREVEQWNL